MHGLHSFTKFCGRNMPTKNSFSEETHPWNLHIPRRADKLLIGTFPTEEKNRKQPFFYCSPTNRLWEVFSNIAAIPIGTLSESTAIKERENVLNKLKLGLTDMGKVILRQRKSSNDHSLFPIEFMDIIKILHEYPSINTIIVSGHLQGNSSLSWFCTYCSLNSIPVNTGELKKKKSTKIFIAGREMFLVPTYSTSRLSRVKTEKLIDAYSQILK